MKRISLNEMRILFPADAKNENEVLSMSNNFIGIRYKTVLSTKPFLSLNLIKIPDFGRCFKPPAGQVVLRH